MKMIKLDLNRKIFKKIKIETKKYNLKEIKYILIKAFS